MIAEVRQLVGDQRSKDGNLRTRIAQLTNGQLEDVELLRKGERPWTDNESFAFGFGFLLDIAARCEDKSHDQPIFAREFRAAVTPSNPPEITEEIVRAEEETLAALQSVSAILAGETTTGQQR